MLSIGDVVYSEELGQDAGSGVVTGQGACGYYVDFEDVTLRGWEWTESDLRKLV